MKVELSDNPGPEENRTRIKYMRAYPYMGRDEMKIKVKRVS